MTTHYTERPFDHSIGPFSFRFQKNPKTGRWCARVWSAGKHYGYVCNSGGIKIECGTRRDMWQYVEYAYAGKDPLIKSHHRVSQ